MNRIDSLGWKDADICIEINDRECDALLNSMLRGSKLDSAFMNGNNKLVCLSGFERRQGGEGQVGAEQVRVEELPASTALRRRANPTGSCLLL